MRGLRQWDPIFLTLFVIGAEVLSRFLNALLLQQRFNPFKVLLGCPAITHFSYADGVVMFSTGLKSSLQLVMSVLNGYYAFLG